MKPLTWILALVALVVVVGVWMLLAEDRPSGDGDAATIVARNNDAESLLDNDSLLPGEGQTSNSVTPLDIASLTTEVELPETALPERYLKALGGITGRVVEEDGTPVSNFPVALAAGGMSTLPIAINTPVDELSEFDPVLAESLTNSEGRFRLTSLPTRVMGLIILDPGGLTRIHALPRAHSRLRRGI